MAIPAHKSDVLCMSISAVCSPPPLEFATRGLIRFYRLAKKYTLLVQINESVNIRKQALVIHLHCERTKPGIYLEPGESINMMFAPWHALLCIHVQMREGNPLYFYLEGWI